jgi:shikimate kinase
MRIYLVGFMGCGKSTYGRSLADALGFNFIDLDAEIEKAEGKSIADFFTGKGEEAFRKAESDILRATAKTDNVVIATGGGAAAYSDNMDWMNQNGTTVYVKLFEPELIRRLSNEQESRPLIKDLDEGQLQEFVHKKLRERAPYYTQARCVVDPLSLEAKELAGLLRA